MTHFQFEIDRVGVAMVRFDLAGESANKLSPDLMEDFLRIIEHCESEAAVRAVVLASAKRNSFVVGGDLRWLRTLRKPAETRDIFRHLHEVVARLESLWREGGKPVVAAIHGPCLGGGLELSLACSHRIASDHELTVLGQPEVKVGLIPGAGGTQRLPAAVGPAAALDLILTGKAIRPHRALGMGLLDEVTDPGSLIERAREAAVAAIGVPPKPRRPRRRRKGLLRTATAALERTRAGRRIIYKKAEQAMRKATKGLYPAPRAALRAVRTGIEEGPEAGFEAEVEEFASILVTPEADALISLFFALQEVKKETGGGSAVPIDTLGIIGGGLMGAGVGSVSVGNAKVETILTDIDEAAVTKAIDHIESQVTARAKRRRTDPQPSLDLLAGTTADADLAGADLIIEAVFEDLALKRQILSRMETVAGPGVIFASNTSAIPIGDIAAEAAHPENVIGMHYFSPVERMPLLEVVRSEATSDDVVATCVAFGRNQGKTVIVVNDGPGFYTTRILAPYGAEVLHLLEDGAAVEDIDSAMVAWGFPVGPITLLDEVGIDVAAKIAGVMEQGAGSRMSGAPPGFSALVADGRLGRKNGRGFYRYVRGKRRGVDDSVYGVIGAGTRHHIDAGHIQDRLSLQMINEAARCLEEGILGSAVDGDVGAVMGLGFPPFRGGPFFHIDRQGASRIVARLDELADRYGDRFTPADILREHAESGKRFRAES